MTILSFIVSFLILAQTVFAFNKPFWRVSVSNKTKSLQIRFSRISTKLREKKFCLNVTLNVKPDRRVEFLELIRSNQKGTLEKEPLARQYTWGESVTEPNTFYFQEQFASKEGFDYHTKTEHFARWQRFADDPNTPFTQPPTVNFFVEL